MPDSINLSNLTELNLEDNKLTRLPQDIERLTRLTKLTLRIALSVDHEQGEEFQRNLCAITSLKSLKLQSNRLTCLSESFGNLTNLGIRFECQSVDILA